MLLPEISFDEQDRNLFQVPDARLRADALKHSVLPRLHALLNEAIASIREVYGLEALKDNTVSYYPQFRPKRTCELELLYDHAFVGLAGKRIKNKWFGFARKDGKPVQFLPFRLGISLAEAGLRIEFQNYWLKGLTNESHRKLFDFHHQHEALITRICFAAEMYPHLYYGGRVRPLSSIREHYKFMEEMGFYDNNFYSNFLRYPMSHTELSDIVENFTFFIQFMRPTCVLPKVSQNSF